MAETQTKTPEASNPLQRIDTLKKAHNEVAGKKGFNPFIVLSKLADLKQRLIKDEKDATALKELSEIPAEPKPLTDVAPEPVPKNIPQIPSQPIQPKK